MGDRVVRAEGWWPHMALQVVGGGRAARLLRPGLQEACTQQEAVRGQRPQE